MLKTLCNLKPDRLIIPVLLASLLLGVVGFQVVLIAHTHKMITGQPLLQGQDHHDLSHLPPLFLSRSRRPIADSPGISSLDEDWGNLATMPFLQLREDDKCYIILLDAPYLSPSNIEIRLQGRELAIQSRDPTPAYTMSPFFQAHVFWERRFRLPGPVAATGPPLPQLSAPGRLRIVVRKAEAPPNAETGITLL